MSALPGYIGTSDVDLFRYRDGIIHLDAKISDRVGLTNSALDIRFDR
jgi:hypothetical protein